MNIDCCKSYVGKQIIGLVPSSGSTPATTCLFSTGQVPDQQCLGFSDPSWDFGGFGNDPFAYAASMGGYVVQDGNSNNCFPFFQDQNSMLTFFFIGTSAPPELTVYDPTFGSMIYPFAASACSYGCLTTGSVRWVNSPYIWADLSFAFISANTQLYGGDIDFSLGAASVESILTLILSRWQPQATVNVTDDGSGFFTITFNDIYYIPSILSNAFSLWYDSGNSNDSTDMIPC